eukprot:gene12163-14237_t
MDDVPVQLKAISPYLKQAKQLEKLDGVMSYYLRMYAVQMAVEVKSKLGPSGASLSTYILKILEVVEKEKQKLGNQLDGEGMESDYVEGFAMKAFLHADTEDRAGRASKSTAVTYYSAFLFFDCLKQFGEQPEEIKQKQKYAGWRAAEINTAIKNGVKPTPPPQEETEESLEDDSDLAFPSTPTNNQQHQQQFPSFPSAPNQQSNQFPSFPSSNNDPRDQPSFPSFPSAPKSSNDQPSFPSFPTSNMGSTEEDKNNAQKYAKWVISALQFDDIPTAIKNLKLSYKYLTGTEL